MQGWLTWTYWVESSLGAFHFLCALAALLLGPYILMRRKGDRLHRLLGRVWAVLMAIIIVSALSMYDMNGRPNLFHFFALVSLVTLSTALWAIWRYKKSRNPDYLVTHQHCMVWAYFGLFMAGFWQIIFNLVKSGIINVGPGLLYNGLGAFTAFASIGLFIILSKKYPAKKKPKRGKVE